MNDALSDPRLALRVIEAVDPPIEATFSASMPTSVEQVEGLSLSQLLAVAQQAGLEIPASLTPS